MREDQIAKLKILSQPSDETGDPQDESKKGALLEMIMGAGKTSVLTPLTVMQKADFDHISVLILPESLIPSMSKELSQRIYKTFGRSIDVLEVNRNFHLSISDFSCLYEPWKEYQKEVIKKILSLY